MLLNRDKTESLLAGAICCRGSRWVPGRKDLKRYGLHSVAGAGSGEGGSGSHGLR